MPQDVSFFAKLENLQVLILQDNLFETLDELKGIAGASKLKHLILADNPIVNVGAMFSKWDSLYRFELVKMIPHLIAIDYHVCTDDEHLFWPDCRSIKYRSQTSFARFKFNIF